VPSQPQAHNDQVARRLTGPTTENTFVPEDISANPYQVLDENGDLVAENPLQIGELRELYRAMVATRLYDRRASALQLQGRLATYAPMLGQEACQIGSAAALGADDWLVGTYRDAGAMWYRGYTWEALLLGRTGDERGGSPPEGVRVLPPSITVGAHMIHAVGLSWASMLKKEEAIALALFGDGATSEGEFHEAANFAEVFRTPTVFFCQNNQYAISVHRSRQTASESIAQKALAYGFPGYLVDGNDVIAVHAATSAAATRARSGDGAAMIEALTYRLGPHTTADDSGRYRSTDEEELWKRRDPLERVRKFMDRSDAWDAAWQEEIEEEARASIDQAVATAEGLPALQPGEFFGAVFAEQTGELVRQARLAERRSEEP
jgi:pyruvate dehydrogenase E1 component alpha subunit